jgi:hypothetical protein
MYMKHKGSLQTDRCNNIGNPFRNSRSLYAGAFTLLGGIATMVAIPFVANVNPNVIGNELPFNGQQPLTPSEQTALAQGSGSILTVLGALLIPLGIASLVVTYGLFKGKGWSWTVAVVL